jgi:hypothetical protein
MRFAIVTLLLTACFGSASELSAVGDDDADPAPAPGAPGTCATSDDCVLIGQTCCECPTMATSIGDPKAQACESVGCDNDLSTCATNVEAQCDLAQGGKCVLACAPLECLECPNGYLTEANGCLSCTCAAPPPISPDCVSDTDCSRVRADCCGCPLGGEDTAVATADAGAFDQALNCPQSPQCPGQSSANEPTCGSDFVPRCVSGACTLLAAEVPAEACGRGDLPDCPAGEACLINVDQDASAYGLGVCR